MYRLSMAILQKTKIPVRGLKPTITDMLRRRCRFSSKNQNPREGIETEDARIGVSDDTGCLQKTKIPVRGLKHTFCDDAIMVMPMVASKNQNPREGIETFTATPSVSFTATPSASKNQNPREGIETSLRLASSLQSSLPASKNQNPREGIETDMITELDGGRRYRFKKPKSP